MLLPIRQCSRVQHFALDFGEYQADETFTQLVGQLRGTEIAKRGFKLPHSMHSMLADGHV
jgi:hypothetical protein